MASKFIHSTSLSQSHGDNPGRYRGVRIVRGTAPGAPGKIEVVK